MTADPHFSPPFDPDSKSLVKKYLTPYIFKTLKPLATDSGFTIEKAIASGLAHSDSHIGLYAGDAQSYQTFALIFDPIIREYHQFKSSQRHQHDWTDIDLPCLDPEKKYILSSRIRVARNLEGFNFPCHINPDERKRLENKIIETLACLKGGFKGQYVSLKTSGEKRLKPLEKKGLLFKKGDRFQEAAGINRDFPQSRGVYFSADTSFRIWVNEEDHLRIMSIAHSGDIVHVYHRLKKGLSALDHHLSYAQNNRYGFLNSCPTNIGTAMRASVHILLPNLENQRDRLKKITQQHHLQIRGTAGEKTKVSHSVFDISNARRLGLTEKNIIQQSLYSGIKAVITAEKKAGRDCARRLHSIGIRSS
jgi:protein-arginine kinase